MLNHPLVKAVVLYGAGSILVGAVSAAVALHFGVPLPVYFVLLAVGSGFIVYKGQQEEEKLRAALKACAEQLLSNVELLKKNGEVITAAQSEIGRLNAEIAQLKAEARHELNGARRRA